MRVHVRVHVVQCIREIKSNTQKILVNVEVVEMHSTFLSHFVHVKRNYIVSLALASRTLFSAVCIPLSTALKLRQARFIRSEAEAKLRKLAM